MLDTDRLITQLGLFLIQFVSLFIYLATGDVISLITTLISEGFGLLFLIFWPFIYDLRKEKKK